nr:ATP-binding protein [Prolixibacteraceae bacterium]
ISDNGVGMTFDQISRIVNNKEPASTYGTHREKGSGLGLLLCKDFIQKNGGVFDVESKPGEGTVFYVSLKRFQV